jgi:hypothetical protein
MMDLVNSQRLSEQDLRQHFPGVEISCEVFQHSLNPVREAELTWESPAAEGLPQRGSAGAAVAWPLAGQLTQILKERDTRSRSRLAQYLIRPPPTVAGAASGRSRARHRDPNRSALPDGLDAEPRPS